MRKRRWKEAVVGKTTWRNGPIQIVHATTVGPAGGGNHDLAEQVAAVRRCASFHCCLTFAHAAISGRPGVGCRRHTKADALRQDFVEQHQMNPTPDRSSNNRASFAASFPCNPTQTTSIEAATQSAGGILRQTAGQIKSLAFCAMSNP